MIIYFFLAGVTCWTCIIFATMEKIIHRKIYRDNFTAITRANLRRISEALGDNCTILSSVLPHFIKWSQKFITDIFVKFNQNNLTHVEGQYRKEFREYIMNNYWNYFVNPPDPVIRQLPFYRMLKEAHQDIGNVPEEEREKEFDLPKDYVTAFLYHFSSTVLDKFRKIINDATANDPRKANKKIRITPELFNTEFSEYDVIIAD